MADHILFLRHFETKLNKEKRISGRSLEMTILEPQNIVGDFAVDHVICSPAVRCRQTLQAFLRDRQVEDVCYVPELVERDMGLLEGRLRSEMAKEYPLLFNDGKFCLFETPPQGESYKMFYDRVKECWEAHLKTQDGTILICSHNQFLKMLYLIILDIPVTEEHWERIYFQNGTVVKIV